MDVTDYHYLIAGICAIRDFLYWKLKLRKNACDRNIASALCGKQQYLLLHGVQNLTFTSLQQFNKNSATFKDSVGNQLGRGFGRRLSEYSFPAQVPVNYVAFSEPMIHTAG